MGTQSGLGTRECSPLSAPLGTPKSALRRRLGAIAIPIAIATLARGAMAAAVASLHGAARAATEPGSTSTPQAVPVWVVVIMLVGAALAGWLIQRERRKAERLTHDLREARQWGQALADGLDVWQWRTDREHRIIQLRPPAGCDIATWSSPAQGLALWAGVQCPDVDALKLCLGSGAPLVSVQVEHRLNGESPVSAVLRGTALTDAEGRFTGYTGTLRDLDNAPQLPTDEASTATAAQASAAATAATAIATAESDHESFSYTVSHDLRAPIRVVEGFTKILKEDYGRLLDRIGNDHLDRVLGAAARMNHMIDALLALSQLSSQPLGRQSVNLSQLATYVAEDLRRQAPERDVKLTIEPGLHVQGDPTLLRVVLENLLGNAWKYTGKCNEPQIWFERDPDVPSGYVVRDNGAGFDMRYADRLFGVFQRLHSANDFHGTGVGLASVRRIVRRHGGDIWAEAEIGQGARFHFSLDAAKARSAHAGATRH